MRAICGARRGGGARDAWGHGASAQPVYKPEEIEEVRSLFRKIDALTTLQTRYGEPVFSLPWCRRDGLGESGTADSRRRHAGMATRTNPRGGAVGGNDPWGSL